MNFGDCIVLTALINFFSLSHLINMEIKYKKLIFNEIRINDVFSDKFDRGTTPFCEPIFLTIKKIDEDSQSFVVESNYNKVKHISFKELNDDYSFSYHKDTK